MPERHKDAPPEADLYAPIEWESAGEYEDILYDVGDGIARITINRPERRNAFRPPTLAELRDAFTKARDDLDVGSIILTGAGDQAFSAGGDLSGGFVDRPLEDHDSRRALADLLRALRVCGKPTVARVNGHALAGGFGLAAACDVVVAADDATFGLPEIKVGLWPMMVTAVLQRVMPHKAVLELMLTGRRITAEEAMRLGAVSRVVPRSELDAAVDLVVSGLAAASPVVTRLGRDAFYGVEDLPFDAALDRLHVGLTAVSATEPGTDDQGLFGPRRSRMMEQTLKAYTEQPYRALRPSEFYSSGFLTENDRLPFGKVLGPVIPEQIRSSSAQATALPLTAIAVEAPRGGSYQIGDTLLVLQLGPEIRSYGDVVVPTGLARVVDTVQGRFVAELVATYGPVRQGQRVLPAEKFTPSGDAHAVPVNDGVQATFIGGAGRQDLKAPQMVVFLDKGRRDGVAPGDLFEIRRHPERLPDGRQLVNDVMATVQVVHVREHTATGRVLNVLSPDIAPGTEARQIARLPS